jgi:cytidyltransferase-like protein
MIVTESELPQIRERHPKARIVLAGGTFDLLHQGHVDYLEACRELGDILVVSIAPDDEVRSRKGVGRPMLGAVERARLIDSFKYPHYTVIRESHAVWTEALVHTAGLLKPDVVVVGPPANPEGIAYLKERLPGVQIAVDRQPKVNSTSDVIRRIKESYHEQQSPA